MWRLVWEHGGHSWPSPKKSERIEVRTPPNIKVLLQQAAVSSQKLVTEFLLEAGNADAENALADRRMFRLGEQRWQAFQEILDRPVANIADIRALVVHAEYDEASDWCESLKFELSPTNP